MNPQSAFGIDFGKEFTLSDPSTNIKHNVITAGDGPAVILMHEITGMTPLFLNLARRIVEAGYRVYLPHFFGPLDKRDCTAGILFCLRHEFKVFSSHGNSPIASWLHLLCERANSECGERGVGVIGLCLTANTVMSAMVHPTVRIGVMCEPALPFLNARALGISDDTISKVKPKALVYPMLAYRFTTDRKCPPERFQTLRDTFKQGVRTYEIPTETEPWLIPKNSHSVLTGGYPGETDPNHPVQHALDQILAELCRRLRAPSNGVILKSAQGDLP